ncbi:MAG: [Fe-Fe] hydrogenase large subunit C-terminal domain-containing protein [Bacteroidales bacterium]
MIRIEINKKIVQVNPGETILAALRSNGIKVPTLCSMDALTPTGACRMCVVEVEGYDHLVPACSFPVEEWMKIKTHSSRVLQARKTNVELLLSNHPDDCLYCERNGNCELQKLAEDLNVRNRKIHGLKSNFKIDTSSFGIIRDPAKCILCGRCVRVCDEIVGVSAIDFERRGDKLQIATAMAEPLRFSSCIDCGMCVVSCPTGALVDHTQFQELDISLDDPDRVVAVQYTPDVVVSIAEEFGFKPGVDLKGIINNALRKIGFDHIFETACAGDLFVMEQAAEFNSRYRKQENLPLITSRCPAWVNYVEAFRPDLISNLMQVRSPHQIMGKLIKTWYSRMRKIPPNRIHAVLITNCTATKQEATRPEYSTQNAPDIDFVLTTRELARLIRLHGIDIQNLDPEPADGPFNAVSSAGKLFAVSGGEAEATLRTIYREFNKMEMKDFRITKLRGNKKVKESIMETQKGDISVVAVSGLKNAITLLAKAVNGKCPYDLIEVMVCPEGCVNGGGQPVQSTAEAVKARIRTIYEIDKNESVRVAHKNNAVKKIYEEFTRTPGSDESREIFMTKFEARKVLK